MAFDKVKFKKKMRTNGFTQKNIAEVLNVDIRTVSRWLDPKISLSSEKIAILCDVIGEAPSDFDPKWEGNFSNTNQARVSAKISSASKNGYWFMRKLYNVSEKDILEIAPTMFALLVDAMFARQNGEDKKLEAASILAKHFDLVPEERFFPKFPEEIEEDNAINEFMNKREILGGEFLSDYSGPISVNPFNQYLSVISKESINAKADTSKISGSLSSYGTAYDIKFTNELTDNDVELNDAIASGEIELFSKEFEQISTNEERIAFMKLKLAESKERKQHEIEQLIKRNPSMKKLFQRMDGIRANRNKTKRNSFWGIHENITEE